jgi:glycosyltransferase involved in cell wall biosynthesis
VEAGVDITLVLVGEGRHRPELESLSASLSLSGRVAFTGELPGVEAVRRVLASSDLFVHPSRAEGLPRVVIEAMAQALPCIATTAGGTPELLPPDDMVQPGDAVGLASKIRSVLADPERLSRMSARNLVKAREYHRSVLQARREELFRHVRLCTEEFVKSSQRGMQVLTELPACVRTPHAQARERSEPMTGRSVAGATLSGGHGIAE